MTHRRHNRTARPVPFKNPLNISQQRFVDEYLIDLDANKAALRAGYVGERSGLTLVSDPLIAAAIALARGQRSARTDIYADEVLRRWWVLATADPNELVQLRRVNCRHCHGTNHEFQRTRAEIDEALRKHEATSKKGKGTAPFDEKGGDGYDPWGDPNPDCPECSGEGIERVYFQDTRNLSPAARLLYAGVEQGPNGSTKLKLRDQEAALLNVAKHLGMHVDRKEVSGPGGEPLTIEVKVVKPSVQIEGDVVEVSD